MEVGGEGYIIYCVTVTQQLKISGKGVKLNVNL